MRRGGHCSDHLLVTGANQREEVVVPGGQYSLALSK